MMKMIRREKDESRPAGTYRNEEVEEDLVGCEKDNENEQNK